MFDFLYLQSYDCVAAKSPTEGHEPCNLTSHVRLYAMGEKYGISQLKEAAMRRFDEEAGHNITGVAFVEAAKLGFMTTPNTDRGLRQSVIRVIHENAAQLNHNEEMDSLIRGIPDLAIGLWKATSALSSGPVCLTCSTVFARSCKYCPKSEKFVSCKCDLQMEPRENCFQHRGDSYL